MLCRAAWVISALVEAQRSSLAGLLQVRFG